MKFQNFAFVATLMILGIPLSAHAQHSARITVNCNSEDDGDLTSTINAALEQPYTTCIQHTGFIEPRVIGTLSKSGAAIRFGGTFSVNTSGEIGIGDLGNLYIAVEDKKDPRKKTGVGLGVNSVFTHLEKNLTVNTVLAGQPIIDPEGLSCHVDIQWVNMLKDC